MVAFAVTVAMLAPSIHSTPQHRDEAQYAWSAGYVGGLVARGELPSLEKRPFSDPRWWPGSYWNVTQPMGTRLVFAGVMAATNAQAPVRPYSFTDRAAQGPETFASPRTLTILRWTATLCAALGFALFGVRLGWRGVAIAVVVLAIPTFRRDLGRAWAEGVLVLGFGLVAVTWRSRMLPLALGLAATVKLTAVGLWPLIFVRRVNGGLSRKRAALVTFATFSLLTPSSWIFGGPLFIVPMALHRVREFSGQSGSSEGLFLPGRYGIPIVLAALVMLAVALPRVADVDRARLRRLALAIKGESRPASDAPSG